MSRPIPSPPSWRPLLEGAQARTAWQAIAGVAEALRPVEEVIPLLQGGSVAGGSAGLALFFTYLALAQEDSAADAANADAEVAVKYFEHSTAELARTVLPPGLYGGFTGIAWADAHLRGRLFEAEEDDEESAIDEALLNLLSIRPWRRDYDLVSGLVGFGVYGLEGVARWGPRRCLEEAVEQLADLAVNTPEGRTWLTPPELLPEHQREAYPAGYFNLGLAHGVPAVISVLARACAAGAAVDCARPLLDEAVNWLLAHQLEAGMSSRFGNFVPAGMKEEVEYGSPARLAWCYGDPGVAIALLGAALAVDERRWYDAALDIAHAAAGRPVDTARISDAGLCHGAAGVGHLFLRMARATGDAELLKAAGFWFEQALTYWQPGRGIGGFGAWQASSSGSPEWEDIPGFLTGSAGIALALLGAVSEVEPEWDRLLLADLPVGTE